MKKNIVNTIIFVSTILMLVSCGPVVNITMSSNTVEYTDSVPMNKNKILENVKTWSCKLTKEYKNYYQDIYDDEELPYKVYINCVVPTENKGVKVSIEIEMVDSLLFCMVKCPKDKRISDKILMDFRNSF